MPFPPERDPTEQDRGPWFVAPSLLIVGGSSFNFPGSLGFKDWSLIHLKIQGVLIPSLIFIRMEKFLVCVV